MRKQYTRDELDKIERRLRKRADKAYRAMEIFRKDLERVKENANLWKQLCESCCISPESEFSDWMC